MVNSKLSREYKEGLKEAYFVSLLNHVVCIQDAP